MKNDLVALTSNNLSEALAKIPEELLLIDPDKLEKDLKPSKKVRELKISIQEEIERARREGRQVAVAKFCRGVMTEAYFRREIIHNKELLAWLFTPTTNADVKMKRIYEDSINHIDMMLDQIVDELQKEDSPATRRALRDQYHKIFLSIANRVAPVVQRSEIKTQEIPFEIPSRPEGDIEERIKQYESELGKNK